MARWIETERGYLNLDYVVEVQRIRSEGGEDRLMLFTEKDHMLAAAHISASKLEQPFDPVVPATVGQEVIWYRAEADESGQRPAEVRTVRVPIVAWRISSVSTLPVLAADYEGVDGDYAIVLPDKRLVVPFRLVPFSSEYENLEELKAEVLKDAQAKWDAEHEQEE